MDFYVDDLMDEEYFSNELKKKAGFGKEGEKGFDGVIAGLQMQMYLCVRDFRQRKNKHGEEYGWPLAIYSTPEHLWGYDHVTSAYKEKADDSATRIAEHMREIYPIASEEQIRNIIGLKPGERKVTKRKK